jgi:MFS family permease
MMFASRLLAGMGAVVANLMVTKLVTDWFVGKELSTALSIAAASFGLGVGVAVGTLGGLAEISSWRFALHSTTALTMCSLVLVLWLYKDLPISDAPTEKSRPGLWHLSGRELILVAIAGLAQIGFIAGYIVFMSFAPTLLIERGYSIAQAGSLVGMAALVAIVSVPLGGFLTDYTGKANLFISGGAIGTALTCLMLVASGSPLVWILLFGLMRGGCTGGIQSMPGQILRPESRGTGFGVYFTVHNLGLAFLPSVAGRLLDTTGGATASVLFAGLIWLIILPSLLVFRLLQNRWSPRVVN